MRRWTKDELELEARKYTKRADFKKGSYSAYQSARRFCLLDVICKHMEPAYLSTDSVVAEAKKYQTRKEFRERSPKHYRSALDGRLLRKICAHMPQRKKSKSSYVKKEKEPRLSKWNFETVAAEAIKYKTRWEFALGKNVAYNAARSLNILEDVCGHMPNIYGRWTFDSIAEEALKYSTRDTLQPARFGELPDTRSPTSDPVMIELVVIVKG